MVVVLEQTFFFTDHQKSGASCHSALLPKLHSTFGVDGHVTHHDMWILPLVGYTGVLLGFGFLTLAIGSI